MDKRRGKIDSSEPFSTLQSVADQMTGAVQEKKIVEVQVPALIRRDDGIIPAKNFELSPIGLVMNPEATIEDWSVIGEAILQLESSLQMVIGDWLNYGEAFGHSVEWVAEQLRRDKKTLQNWSWVASKFPHSLRRETILFGHYSLLAARPIEVQADAIQLTLEHNWTVAELRQYLLGLKHRKYNTSSLNKKAKEYRGEIRSIVTKASKLPIEHRSELIIYLRQLANELEQIN